MQRIIVWRQRLQTWLAARIGLKTVMLPGALILLALQNATLAGEQQLYITAIGNNLELVLLPAQDDNPATDVSTSEGFVPLAGSLRDRVGQRLRELRVRYRQLGLSVEVRARPDQANARQLADQLASMLASAYLSSSVIAPKNPMVPAGVRSGIVVTVNPGDKPVVTHLLQALSPVLSGAVLLHLDASVDTAKAHIAILGGMAFFPDGRVKLPQIDSPAAVPNSG